MSLTETRVTREHQYDGFEDWPCKEGEATIGEENKTRNQINNKTFLQNTLHSCRWPGLTEGSYLL